jgi:hypothetical protein
MAQAVAAPLSKQRALQLFKTTYNAQYLNAIPDSFFTNKIWLDNEYSTMNETQKKLFKNFLSVPTYLQYDSIEGPCLLTVAKTVNARNEFKNFLLFSEYHNIDVYTTSKIDTTGRCALEWPSTSNPIHIKDYLSQLAMQTSQFLDVFVEIPQFSKGKQENKVWFDNENMFDDVFIQYFLHYYGKTEKFDAELISILQNFVFEAPNESLSTIELTVAQIKDQFLNCLHPDTRSTDPFCNLLRFHYIDIRRTIDLSDRTSFRFYVDFFIDFVQTSLFTDYTEYDSRLQALNASFTIQDVCYDLVFVLLRAFGIGKFLTSQNFSDPVSVVTAFYDKMPDKIKASMKNSEMRERIFQFVATRPEVSRKIEELGQYWANVKVSVGPDFEQVCKKLCLCLITLQSAILDCYCLCRVFRKFSHKDPNTQQPELGSTFVIYAGGHHTQVYTEFLNELVNDGTLVLTEVMSEGNPYIDIENPQFCVPITSDMHIYNHKPSPVFPEVERMVAARMRSKSYERK